MCTVFVTVIFGPGCAVGCEHAARTAMAGTTSKRFTRSLSTVLPSGKMSKGPASPHRPLATPRPKREEGLTGQKPEHVAAHRRVGVLMDDVGEESERPIPGAAAHRTPRTSPIRSLLLGPAHALPASLSNGVAGISDRRERH